VNRDDRKDYLRTRGWYRVKGLWRCFAVSYGWPLEAAYRLVREAEAGDVSARRILGMDLSA
jgi:hypothetical protein